jgi:hypothetical protein
MKVSRIHGRDLPRRDGFVNNCNKADGGVLSEGWPAQTTSVLGELKPVTCG